MRLQRRDAETQRKAQSSLPRTEGHALFAARRSLRAEEVTTPKKKAKARTITVSWRRGPRRGTMGPEGRGEARGSRRGTGAGWGLSERVSRMSTWSPAART